MARALILTTDGCSDTEREYAYHRFREDGRVVDIASQGGGTVESDRGAFETRSIADLPVKDYDTVVLPDGWTPEVAKPMVLDWLDAYLTADAGVLGLSGTAVELLAHLDAIDLGRRTVTAPVSTRGAIEAAGATVQEELVTVDGRLVTARNTDALPFFLVAVRSNVTIPQALAHRAHERASW